MSVPALLVLLYHLQETAAFGAVSLHLNGLSLQPCGCAANSSANIPKNAIPTTIEAYRDEVFLTYPRYREGVAITLGVLDTRAPRAAVRPFPRQEMQTLGDCRALQSAEDTSLEDQVLWVLDTGVVDSLGRARCVCPPKVVGLCVRTGAVVEAVDLSGMGAEARPQFVAAERAEDGSVYVYVSDAATASLWCVHASGARRGRAAARRVRLPAAERCGVLYLARLHRLLLLHCRGSPDVFAVHTERLRAGQLGAALTRLGPAPGAADLVFLGTDRRHTLYYRFEGSNSVQSWDTRGPLSATRPPQEPAAPLAVAGVAGDGRRAPLALAVDVSGYAAGRVGCVGAEARVFTLD